jgi:hypothetical protein
MKSCLCKPEPLFLREQGAGACAGVFATQTAKARGGMCGQITIEDANPYCDLYKSHNALRSSVLMLPLRRLSGVTEYLLYLADGALANCAAPLPSRRRP